MKDAVLLLGGGLMQLPAIHAAKELGLSRHMADGNDKCPGRELVEHFHHVDLRDRKGLLEVARTIPGLKGVFTAGTDFSRSVASVAEQLGLPGISEDTAIRATDKGIMRECLESAGVAVPRYAVVPEGSEAPFSYPFIVKPADNMGARGVVLVHDTNAFIHAVKRARSLSTSRRVIAEEFIPGQEYSIDALVHDGVVHVTGIGERHIFFPPCFVELGHSIPAKIDRDEEDALVDVFSRAIAALGIVSGAAKGDVFLLRRNGEKPNAVIGEIAARLSGGFMSGWTYPLATGVPLTRLGLEVALGRSPDPRDLRPIKALFSAERALISGPGTVSSIELPEARHPDVAEIFVHNRPGDPVAPPQNNVEKIVNVIVTSETPEMANSIAEDMLDRILVRLEPGNPQSDDFFFHNGWEGSYCRYRTVDKAIGRALKSAIDVTRAMASLPGPHGKPSDFHGAATEGDRVGLPTGHPALVILPPDEVPLAPDDLVRNQVSISASDLLSRLEYEGIVKFSTEAHREGTLLFWRAFLAGGRQGVLYLQDTVGTAGGAR